MIVIRNVKLAVSGEKCTGQTVIIESGKIAAIVPETEPVAESAMIIDGCDNWLTAGLIDLHLHVQGDWPAAENSSRMHQLLAAQTDHGVTTIFPTLIDSRVSDFSAVRFFSEFTTHTIGTPMCKVGGLHLEGPFLNPAKRGGFPKSELRPPSVDAFNQMLTAADGCLRRITLSPELPGSMEVARMAIAAGVIVSIGHTTAKPGQIKRCADIGIRLVTHFLNAMPPFHHRDPGPIGAILADNGFILELISDGQHLDPLTVKLCLNLPHQIALITDSNPIFLEPPGRYSHLGTPILWDGTRLITETGTLIGGGLFLNEAVARACRFSGLPFEKVIRLANEVPAAAMGLTDRGKLTPGCAADLIVLDENGQLFLNMIDGKICVNKLNE
ncbi:N-acetylglucosamine-6-phosphate deacetylase [bacterium]|nr:N-acetylglucosamine-6-phosphate deacetylase [bacterium]